MYLFAKILGHLLWRGSSVVITQKEFKQKICCFSHLIHFLVCPCLIKILHNCLVWVSVLSLGVTAVSGPLFRINYFCCTRYYYITCCILLSFRAFRRENKRQEFATTNHQQSGVGPLRHSP